MPVFDLVDSIKPGAVTYDDIKHDTDEEVRYCISMVVDLDTLKLLSLPSTQQPLMFNLLSAL